VKSIKKTLYSGDEMLARLKLEAEKLLSGEQKEPDLNLSEKEIQELLHQIQVQHIELEMQNDELKLSNEEVESQRHKFASLYDLAPVGYFILDPNGIVLEVNTTGGGMLESPKRNILTRRFQNFINPEDGELFYNFLRRAFQSKVRQGCQLTLLKPDGTTLHAQLEGVLVQSAVNQKQNQCYIAVIDVTERRHADLKLNETKERLEMALEASVAGTWQIDLKTEEIILDDFSCQIYGLKRRGRASQSLNDFIKLIHPDDRTYASTRFGEAISRKTDLDVEYRIVRPDNTIGYVSARGHVVEGNLAIAMCFVGILLDITERKLLEEEALKLKAEHQRNILTTVLGTQENERRRISEALHDSVSQLLYGIKLKLQDYRKSDKDSSIYLELSSLIAQAVNETRNISFELAPSILNDFGLPTAIVEMAKRLNSTKIKIETRILGLKDRFELHTELSIFRIIQELVNNVLKHSGASLLTIELIKKNKTLNIIVSDNGKGFNPDALKASGTGLHSIKNRLDLLNGTLQITTNNGAGTKVNISFKDIS
jgi:PAS domain S-box-containing protein